MEEQVGQSHGSKDHPLLAVQLGAVRGDISSDEVVLLNEEAGDPGGNISSHHLGHDLAEINLFQEGGCGGQAGNSLLPTALAGDDSSGVEHTPRAARSR